MIRDEIPSHPSVDLDLVELPRESFRIIRVGILGPGGDHLVRWASPTPRVENLPGNSGDAPILSLLAGERAEVLMRPTVEPTARLAWAALRFLPFDDGPERIMGHSPMPIQDDGEFRILFDLGDRCPSRGGAFSLFDVGGFRERGSEAT